MRILLLLATASCYESGAALPVLKRIYEEKRANDDFEIIYISLDCDECPSSFDNSIQEMPWLVHPFIPNFAHSLIRRLFNVYPLANLPAIAAFGSHGHLDTKESGLAFKCLSKPVYPFIQADMHQEVYMELAHYLQELQVDPESGYRSD